MKKLPEVEEAKALLNVAKDWSIWRWLTEKRRVRGIADRGTAALDRADEALKASWPDNLRVAYNALVSGRKPRTAVSEPVRAAAARVKEADDEAYAARMDAENTFEEAERHLSAGLAREGARKAIEAYDLRERALRKSEAAIRASAKA